MQETGKSRANRINRAYHAVPDPWVIRKRLWGGIAVVVACLFSCWLFASPRGALQVSTGELSHAHAAWNNTGCDNCHVPNVSIREDAIGGSHFTAIQETNTKCSACHAMTTHFAHRTTTQKLTLEGCARCHREHLGADRSPIDLGDADCVRCHDKLSTFSNRKLENDQPIKIFSASPNAPLAIKRAEHPPFRSLNQDTGTIKFSHRQHLRPGQPVHPGDRTEKKLSNLPERYRAKYKTRVAGPGPEGLIQLQCSDCHERDVPLAGYDDLELADWTPAQADHPKGAASKQVQSSTHALYTPVTFEKHCIACHDLNEVPHGLSRSLTEQAFDRLIPVKMFDQLRQREPHNESHAMDLELVDAEYDDLKSRLSALNQQWAMCSKCHVNNDNPSLDSIVLLSDQPNNPSGVPKRWFSNAVFTHSEHLMVGCKACHAKAYEDSDAPVQSKEEAGWVMIDQIEKCRECHISDPEERSKRFSGNNRVHSNKHVASADCVDCHRYHVDPPNSTSLTDAIASQIQQREYSIPEQLLNFLRRGSLR